MFHCFTIDSSRPRKQQIEDDLVVVFGGIIAEEMCVGSSIAGSADLEDIFGLLRELHRIEGKDFPYVSFSEVPRAVYAGFEEESRNILLRNGGKTGLENAAGVWLEGIENQTKHI